jgi:PAS domain S-box-containing protein
VDEEENLLFANKSLLEHFRLTSSAFWKKSDSIIPANIADTFHEKHNAVLKCNHRIQSIVKSPMADGKEHVYQVIVFPIRNTGTSNMVGGEALDITESYNARQEEKKSKRTANAYEQGNFGSNMGLEYSDRAHIL